jgi:hypothetical protein
VSRASSRQRRQQVVAGLFWGASVEPTYARAGEAAKPYLRGQGLRVKQAEFDEVADVPLRNVLFPPCDCMPGKGEAGAVAELFERQDRETPGPHHSALCPMWRAVRL